MSKYTAFDLGIMHITVDQHQGARNPHTNKSTNTQQAVSLKVHSLEQPDRHHGPQTGHTFQTPDLQQEPLKAYTFGPPNLKKEHMSETFQMYHVRHMKIKSPVRQTKQGVIKQTRQQSSQHSTPIKTKSEPHDRCKPNEAHVILSAHSSHKTAREKKWERTTTPTRYKDNRTVK